MKANVQASENENKELNKNSINSTTNLEKIEENYYVANLDKSKNTGDPLSVIDNQETTELIVDNGGQNDEFLVFSKLFPNVSYEKLLQNEHFRLFSSHNGKNLTISNLYTNYLRLIGALEDDFAKKSLVLLQNKLVSPGSLASSEKTEDVFFTKEQVLKMNREQIAKNYEIIRKSQQKW